MQVQRIDHMHAWTDDVDRVAMLFREVFGLTCDIYNHERWQIKTVVVRVGQDRPFIIEFMQPNDPTAEKWQAMGRPGTTGVFGVDLKVPDMDKAIDELKSRGIRLIRDSTVGKVRQAWFDTEKTFGVQIELSEYLGDDIIDVAQLSPPLKNP